LYISRHRAENRHGFFAALRHCGASTPRNERACTLTGHIGITFALSLAEACATQLEHNDKSLHVQEG